MSATDLSLLASDDAIVVVDKPAGLPVIPGRDGGDCVHHRLQSALGIRLWICHRLDQDTTGVVVFAKTAAAHRAINLSFEHHQIQKQYVAMVVGHLDPPNGIIDAPLHPSRKGKMRLATSVDEEGALASVTRYETWHAGAIGDVPLSLVRLFPQTGRQHQLRVHLRSREHPIVFDALYGTGLQKAAIAVAAPRVTRPRHLLHAGSLTLPSVDGGARTFTAPIPADLRAVATAMGATIEP